jgi:hypothetical protein
MYVHQSFKDVHIMGGEWGTGTGTGNARGCTDVGMYIGVLD